MQRRRRTVLRLPSNAADTRRWRDNLVRDLREWKRTQALPPFNPFK